MVQSREGNARGEPPAETPPVAEVEGDPVTQRLIVMFLGIAIVLVILFVFLIRLDGGEIPDSLIALGSSAIGAMAGFLTGTRGAAAAPTPRSRRRGLLRGRGR